MDNILLQDINFRASTLVDKLILGPQAETLRKVKEFNDNFDGNIRVTKKFRWAPGIYDEVKRILSRHYLGWDKRASKMETLFNRMENNAFFKRRITQSILSIDSELLSKRQMGAEFQENKEEVKEYLNVFSNQVGALNNFEHPNVSCKITTTTAALEKFNEGESSDLVLDTQFVINPKKIKLSAWDSHHQVDDYIGEIPFDMHIILKYRLSFINWFNRYVVAQQYDSEIERYEDILCRRNWDGSTYSNQYGMVEDASTYFNNMLMFPYISRSSYNKGTICLGDMQSIIYSYWFNLNPMMLFDELYRWSSVFIVNKSNPYNRIKTAFHGQPKGITSEHMIALDKSTDPDECSYRYLIDESYDNTEDETLFQDVYCDRSECQLKSKCAWYNHTVLLNEDWQAEPAVNPETQEPLATPRSLGMELEGSQRSSTMPSWMIQDDNGVWVDSRTVGNNLHAGETGDETAYIEHIQANHQDIIESHGSVDESDNAETPF
tara:strand:- start:1338 stop:2813 length:1476 start_codon:yes stop_codon:yes gene_type:complete